MCICGPAFTTDRPRGAVRDADAQLQRMLAAIAIEGAGGVAVAFNCFVTGGLEACIRIRIFADPPDTPEGQCCALPELPNPAIPLGRHTKGHRQGGPHFGLEPAARITAHHQGG